MKRLFIFGLLALAGCGNADKANDALPVKELMAKSKTELTAEQWNVKKTLFKVLTENVEFENGEFVLDITKKEFTENGLPASYYKEAKNSLKDMNRFLKEMKRKNPDAKFVVIDACMRPESRTKRILAPILESLEKRYEIETFSLNDKGYPAVGEKILRERADGYVPEEFVRMARAVAEADRIAIAAPFWDMSFPSALKVFFENISLFNVTFADNGSRCVGLCRAEKVMYVTTRGMDIATGDPLEQATPYIKALSWLWGLGELHVVSAQNLDYSTPEQVDAKIAAAVAEGLKLCEEF